LIVFSSQFIHPSKFTVTPFTRNVSNPMSSCQHYSFGRFAVI
jgi:hypothetical protein